MTTSVRDVLAMEGLDRARVAGGEAGLERQVRWITVGEEPDLPDWIFGGELILSTLFAIPAGERGGYVERLCSRGSAGLFVKPHRFMGGTPEELVETAERISFPVVEVPSEVLWSRILASFYHSVLREQAERIRVETEMRMRGGFVEEMISEDLGSGEISRRARFLDCDLSGGGTAVVFDVKDFAGLISARLMDETRVQQVKNIFYETVQGAVGETHRNHLCALRSDSIVAILGGAPGDNEALARRVLSRCEERLPNMPVYAGIGRGYTEPAGVPASYREAESALDVAQGLKEPGSRISAFDRLATERLLFSIRRNDHSSLQEFQRRTIAPLLEYDERHGTYRGPWKRI